MSESTQGPAATEDPNERFASLLASEERIIVVRQRHWATFINAARWFVLVLAAGVAIGLLREGVPSDGILGWLHSTLGWGFTALVLVGLAGVGWYYLEWRRERYLVTTRRVIEAGGIINTFSRDTSLQMITDMLVSHPWLGRILGYGQIDLLTASEAGTTRIRFLPKADEFKRSLLDARHEYELEVGGGKVVHDAAPAPTPQPAAEAKLSGEELDSSLTHLADLRDRGLITPEEFEQKKQELLDRV
jgi:uncharacterized membrane protein YdbT with pleckstrin-like domain